MHGPRDLRHVEGPMPVEEFAIHDQPLASLREAFRTRTAEGLFEAGPRKHLAVLVIADLHEFLEIALAHVLGGKADRPIHEAEARLESQRQEPAERISLVEMLRRRIVAEGAIAAAGDARHMDQARRIDVGGSGERPGPAFRPAGHAEAAIAQRIGDMRQVAGPAFVGAIGLRA